MSIHDQISPRFKMYEKFFSGCRLPVVLEPYISNDSCTGWCSRNEDVGGVPVAGGSCYYTDDDYYYRVCTEGTKVRLIITLRYTFVGSTLVTCTNDGWFPSPKIDKFPAGKWNISVN